MLVYSHKDVLLPSGKVVQILYSHLSISAINTVLTTIVRNVMNKVILSIDVNGFDEVSGAFLYVSLCTDS